MWPSYSQNKKGALFVVHSVCAMFTLLENDMHGNFNLK